jgi:hypothetical protein
MYIVKLGSGILWKRHIDQIVPIDTGESDVNKHASSNVNEQLLVEPIGNNDPSADEVAMLPPTPSTPQHTTDPKTRRHDVTPSHVTPYRPRASRATPHSPAATVKSPAGHVNKGLPSPHAVRRSQRERKPVERLNL